MHKTLTAVAISILVTMALGGGIDDDNDGVPNDLDCRPDDGSLWAPPATGVTDLTLTRAGAVALLRWSTPLDTGGDPGTERYDTYGTLAPDAFGYSTGFCVELDDGSLAASDDRNLRPGQVAHYLVRIENECGTGPIDTDPPPIQPRSLNYVVARNTDDSGPGSLREAIDLALDGDAVCVDSSGTLTLASDLTVDKSISIVGPGADQLAITSGTIRTLQPATISDMTVKETGTGINVWGGPTTIASMNFTDVGSAVFSESGTVTIIDSNLSASYAGFHSGFGGGQVTLISSTISGATNGLLANEYWEATVIDSTLTGNYFGISQWLDNRLTINNSTISGNEIGISAYGTYTEDVTITSSTITGNVTGIELEYYYATFQNTVLSNTTNCAARSGNSLDILSDGYNVSSDTSCTGLSEPGDQVNVDPLLGPLADNGGPTRTHLPLSGSPLIDAGSCPDLPRDQRGLQRVVDDPGVLNVDDGCDIGAVEKQ